MFDALKIRFTTFLRSPRSLSRHIRKVFQEAYEHREEWRTEIEPLLKEEIDKGNAEQVVKLLEDALKFIGEEGQLQILEDEKSIVGLDIKFMKLYEDIPEEFHRLEQAVKSSNISKEEKKELLSHLKKDKIEVLGAFEQFYKGIRDQYRVALAEEKAKEGGDEHTFVVEGLRSFSFGDAADAAKNAFKLRGDYKDEKGEELRMEELVKDIVVQLEAAGDKHDEAWKRIENDEGDIRHVISDLSDHIKETAKRFTIIMQVFAHVFFLFVKDLKDVRRIVAQLKQDEFPAKELQEINLKIQHLDNARDTLSGQVDNALTRIRRLIQAEIAELKA